MLRNLIIFIKERLLAVSLCSAVYVFYLYLTFSGNRFCDCEQTESSKLMRTNSRSHFYHK